MNKNLDDEHPSESEDRMETDKIESSEKRGWSGVPPKYEIKKKLIERARELRREMTPAERKLWGAIRRSQLGVKFRKQHPIDRFIADFYCPKARLIVEVDGSAHEETVEQDAVRTAILEELGLVVVRYTNGDVMRNLEGVVVHLRGVIEAQIRE